MASLSLVFDLLARDRASSAFRKVGNEAEKAGKKTSGFGSSAAKGMAAAGAAVAGLGIGAVLADSVQKAGTFDKTLRTLAQTTGTSGKGLAELRDVALDFGAKTTFSAQDAGAAMLELARGGLTTAQIKAGALAETLTLASAGNLELGDAASYVVQGLNTFGLSAKEANQVAAALAGGANASTASVESMGLALSQVGPGAVNAGLSIQETTAAIAAFSNSGIQGSDAGTSLKTMLTRLVPTTDAARGAMEDLGLKFTDAQGAILPLRDISQQLQDRLSGLSQEQRTQALATIFGSDATRAASILMKEGATGIDKYTKATSDLTAAEDLAKVGTEGFAGAMEAFKGSVETLQIQLGEKLLPVLTNVLNFATDHMLPGVQRAFDALGSIKVNWGAAFSGIKEAAIKAGGELLKQFKVGLDTGNWAPLGESIIGILGSALDRVGSLAGRLFNAIGRLIDKVDWAGLALQFGKVVPTLLLGLITGILNFDFGKMASFIADHLFEVVIGALTIVFLPARIFGALTRILGRVPIVGPLINWFLRGIRGVGGKIAGWVGDIVKGFFRGLVGGTPRIVGAVRGWVENIRVTLYVWASDFLRWMGALPGRAAGVAEKFGGVVRAAFARIFKAAFDAVKWLGRWLLDNVLKPIFTRIQAAFTVMGRGLRWVVDNVIKPAWGAVRTAINWLWNNVLRPVFGAIRAGWDSLGRLLRWVYDRWIAPVFRTFAGVGETVRKAFRAAVDKIIGIWSGVKALLTRPIQAVIDVVWNNGLRRMWNTVNNIWEKGSAGNLPEVRLARGGVIPGYAPGRDSVPAILSPGEAVMRPEFARALGPANIDALNELARQQGVEGVRQALAGAVGDPVQRFADGGIVRPGLSTKAPGWLSGAASWLSYLLPGGMAIGKTISTITDHIKAANSANLGGGMLGSGLASMAKGILGKMWSTAKSLFDSSNAARSQGSGGTYGTPNGVGGLGPAAARAHQFVRSNWGFGGTIGGYAYRNIAGTNQLSKHALGKAIDVMTYSNMGLGQSIANYFAGPGRARFGVDNVIWNRAIHSGRGWAPYYGASPHTDHPHIDFYKTGTPFVPHDGLAYLHRGERVVPAAANGNPVQVRVFIGDRELTDIVRVEAETVTAASLMAVTDRGRYNS